MAIVGCQKGLEMVESQGKVSEKSGNLEMEIQWQPCGSVHLKPDKQIRP